MSDVTRLLERLEAGQEHAGAELFEVVYSELRRIARWHMAQEKAGHTLEPTALVHEAFVRLVGAKQQISFSGRSGFFSAASEAMRHILVDAARRKLAQKRGGAVSREDRDLDSIVMERPEELVAIHEALAALHSEDPQCAELVKLHYFGGFSLEEIAEQWNVSRATTNRWWRFARAWMRTRIESDSNS